MKTHLSFLSPGSVCLNSLSVAFLAVSSLGPVTKTKAATAPAITSQPTSQTVSMGTTATFNSTVTGSLPLNYQWNLNGAKIIATDSGVSNTWENGTSLPLLMVEMTSAWLGDKLYLTGMTNAYNPAPTSPMFTYDLSSQTWTRQIPDRPFTGNHHRAEVIAGKLYFIGGCDANSDGKVQIYDPVANTWSLGAPMPFAAGAGASAVINGKIYYAGGIVGEVAGSNIGYNTNAAAVYDPVLNTWTMRTPVPIGMNHTASGTDGTKLYLFGGRAIGNAPDNGYNTVQIYDPQSNTWVTSSDPGSTIRPLPQARGGMGNAPYYNGDFYVMGGETVNGSGATANHVYNRVDIYSVPSNTWRLGTPMPTARHGIYPALHNNRIYVAGGGVAAGVSYSSVNEIYVTANGGRISGANSRTLTITSVQATDAGNYTLVATNSVGSVTSVVATLTVNGQPVITGQPVSRTMAAGANANFSITASGTSPLSYRWLSNGNPLNDGGAYSGTATASLAINNAQMANAGNYIVVVTNPLGSVTSSVAVLTVLVPPTMTSQPVSQTVNAGTAAGFSATASGSGPLSYQWKLSGVNLANNARISGATSSALAIANVQATDAGNYTLVVTNAVGVVTSSVATLTVNGPPIITQQPSGQSVQVGANLNMSVVASGTAPLSYRWVFNGNGLSDGGAYSGTATASLAINNAQPANAGGYSLVVTNVAGTVTSSVAALTVTVPGSCVTAPVGLVGWWPGDGGATNYFGTNNGTLQGGATANAVGKDGQAFTFNGTTAFVQIPDSPILRPTNLTVEAWVNFNSLNSSGNAPAGQQYVVFKQNTRSGNFEGYFLGKARGGSGDYFVFDVSSSTGVSATANGTPGIQTGVWYHVAGVRGPNYLQLFVNGQLVSQVSVSFAQDYGILPLYFGTSGQSYWDGKLAGLLDEVSLYNRALSLSEIAAIYAAGSAGKCKAGSPPSIGTQPQSQNVAVGGSAALNVSASGAAPLSYQWLFNGNSLSDGGAYSGTTTASLAINNAQVANAGNYSVVVTNLLGSVTSSVAVVGVLVPPTMTSQPVSQTVNAGTIAGFNATASGSAPLSYQWKLSGVNLANSARITGATSTTLSIANVQATDAGNYTLVVTNAVGVVTSSVAVLTVNGPPIITQQPSGQNVQAGANANVSVGASGTAPLSYRWLFNGSALSDGGSYSGTATASLALNNAQPVNAGGYSVVVTNVAGAVTSSVAALTVTVPGSCVTPPAGLVGWWPGDGGPTNYFGTNNGTLQGGATANGVGMDGLAFSFNGTTAYVQVPDSPILRPTNLTVEAWVNFSSLDSSGNAPAGEQYIVFKQNTRSGNFEGYFLGKMRGSSGDFFVFDVSSSTGVPATATGTPGIQTGVWYHVVGVRGPNYLQLYVNGQLVSQVSVSFAQNYGTLPLYFGSSGQSYWDRKLAGLLDEVSLYNRALSASEIAAIYTAGAAGKCKGVGPLIVSQPADEANGDTTSISYLNHAAEVQAEVVPLLIPRQPSIQSVVVTNGAAVIIWSSKAGSVYRVQFTDDLGSAAWKDVQPDVQATGPTAHAIDNLNNSSRRFYRIVFLR